MQVEPGQIWELTEAIWIGPDIFVQGDKLIIMGDDVSPLVGYWAVSIWGHLGFMHEETINKTARLVE